MSLRLVVCCCACACLIALLLRLLVRCQCIVQPLVCNVEWSTEVSKCYQAQVSRQLPLGPSKGPAGAICTLAPARPPPCYFQLPTNTMTRPLALALCLGCLLAVAAVAAAASREAEQPLEESAWCKEERKRKGHGKVDFSCRVSSAWAQLGSASCRRLLLHTT